MIRLESHALVRLHHGTISVRLDLLFHHDLILDKVLDDLAVLLLALESHLLLRHELREKALDYRLLLLWHLAFLKELPNISNVFLG